MNVLYGILLAGMIVIGVLFMSERIEDARTQRIWAQTQLVHANAAARQGMMTTLILGLGGLIILGMIVMFGVVITWPKTPDPNTYYANLGRRFEAAGPRVVKEISHVHHYRVIERTVVYVRDTEERKELVRRERVYQIKG